MKKGKLLKAVLSAFAAAALTAVTAVSAFAANTPVENGKIVINNPKEGHTYEAYQIFDGDMTKADDGTYTLSNIVWGSGVNTDAEGFADAVKGVVGTDVIVDGKVNAAKVAEKLTETTIKDFASAIGAYVKGTPATSTFADGKYTINITDPGYYLVKDQDGTLADKDDAYTRYIVQVLGEVVDVNPKSDKPTVEKKVQDDEDTTEWNDVADYNIGDAVPFKLTATLPVSDEFDAYETYKLVFTDTLSKGLKYDSTKAAIKFSVGGTPVADGITPVVTDNADGSTTLTFTIDDVKTISGCAKGAKVEIEYSAILDNDAVIGLPGNPNEVDLTYSNNPNGTGEGKTPKDQVVVFTYELDVTKIDGATKDNENPTKLAGAEFKLKNADNKWVIVDADGKVTGWADSEDAGSILTSDANGIFKVIGLNEGTYSLKETKAPDGYNLLQTPVELVITADDVHNLEYTGSNASDELTAVKLNGVDGNTSEGLVSTTVENNKGSQLPSTGGIGTTIFYVCGGIIVAAAAVLLIVKMRKREA